MAGVRATLRIYFVSGVRLRTTAFGANIQQFLRCGWPGSKLPPMIAGLETFAAWALAALVGAFLGSFLAGYLKKKGENLATHEDIQKLVDQVSAVTTATQEIESKISGELWDRQKRWELKRDVVFEVTRNLSAVRNALADLSVSHKMIKASPTPDAPPAHLLEDVVKESHRWFEVSRAFAESIMLVDLVCGPELGLALSGFDRNVSKVAADLDRNAGAFDESMKQMLTELRTLTALIRKELGAKL
jgi:hypothetical protein